MADNPENQRSLSTFADRVFGGNPFPGDDARHELWEATARYATEEYARLDAKWLSRLPSEQAQPEEFLGWVLDFTAERYDVLCKVLLLFGVHTIPSVAVYEDLVALIVKSALTNAVDKCPRSLPKVLLLSELRIRLKQRTSHWTAEAFRLAGDSEEPKGGTPSVAQTREQPAEVLQPSASAANDFPGAGPPGPAVAQRTNETEITAREVGDVPPEVSGNGARDPGTNELTDGVAGLAEGDRTADIGAEGCEKEKRPDEAVSPAEPVAGVAAGANAACDGVLDAHGRLRVPLGYGFVPEQLSQSPLKLVNLTGSAEEKTKGASERAGDPLLLADRESVSFYTARQYLI